jgi:cyclohexanecarboxylate-CoA ligase
VLDVEAQLRQHPAIADVAVVGYPLTNGLDGVCAVIVSTGIAPTLIGLRAYLTDTGMTEHMQPTRVEVVDALPRNVNGKVLKRELRQRLDPDDTRPS